ncbi:MAG: carboxypeptidase-like regulatory domain-containing protein, partial [Bacteroidia bacterium]|nr:carboxypeptidase-like regulatory domain-containing protein [Bacteroidia bacterium]
MKKLRTLLLIGFLYQVGFGQRSSPTDGSWSKPFELLRFTRQADVMIRVGDIDNLGFGFPENFDPFSGRATDVHPYPWETNFSDPDGTDRIMVCSGYKGEAICGSDGYTNQTQRPDNSPRPIKIPLDALKNTRIQTASLQIFIDDFQSPEYCSRFRVWLNGKVRFRELESILREINQTRPIGKLVNVNFPPDHLPLLKEPTLTIMIDDSVNQAGDGFAIDFVKLLINPKVDINRGNLTGKVVSKHTGEPIAKATIELIAGTSVLSADDGSFQFNSLTSGYTILKVSAKGFQTHYEGVDIITAETKDVFIELDAPKMLSIGGRLIAEGESIS